MPCHIETVCHLNDGVDETIGPDSVVIAIDVLRASSTITAALEAGCSEVWPVATIEAAQRRYRSLCAQGVDCVIGGERGGLRVDGFQLGNSPLEYTPEMVAGKSVVLTTTNGTKALTLAGGGAQVLVGSLRNTAAVISRVARLHPPHLVILPAGRQGRFSLEDSLCAGFMASGIVQAASGTRLDDLSTALKLLVEAACDSPAAFRDIASLAGHAQHLQDLGRNEDIDYCLKVNASQAVPVYLDGRIVLAEGPK